MFAEVAQATRRSSERARVAAETSTWPPVARRGDPGGAVDVGADVALVRQQRRARVNAHPHRDRQRRLGFLRGRQRTRRGRERDEERIALRVDLDAAVPRERVAQDASMLGERLRVLRLAELVQQPRRALDVGEEEGDGAGRELAHPSMIRQKGPGA